MTIQYVIAKYRIIHRHAHRGVAAEIHLYDAHDKMVGSVYFMENDADLRPAMKDPRIMIFFPERRYRSTVDLLRSGSGVVLVYKAPNEAYLTDTSRLNTEHAHLESEEDAVDPVDELIWPTN